MKVFSYIIILLILILGITFAVLNAMPVTVHYYIGTKQMPLSLLLVIGFVFGLFVSLIFMSFVVIRLKSRNRRLRKQLKISEKEIDNLRVMPIKD